ncbi:MAG TPA: dienelactone hydrolase family protein [Dehalococcoidia bacterium]
MAGQMVSFQSNGGTADGYLATPASGKGPGIIVIQEWWGLNDNIKQIADRFAAEGFAALAPDLYHGKLTKEPDEAQKMLMSLNMPQAAKDMAGAFDYLAANDACTGKIGSVGFCMGGGLSLTLATVRPVSACVMYYGMSDADVTKLQAPVLGHFAENDGWVNAQAVGALESKLRSAGKPFEFHTYPGTDHAFFNDTRPEVFSEPEAKQCWDRTIAFYKQHLA